MPLDILDDFQGRIYGNMKDSSIWREMFFDIKKRRKLSKNVDVVDFIFTDYKYRVWDKELH